MDRAGVEYEPRDYARRPLTPEDLADIVGSGSAAAFVNPRSPAFRKLGIAHQDLDDESALRVMDENNVVVRRPIVVRGEERIIGLDVDAFERLARAQAAGA